MERNELIRQEYDGLVITAKRFCSELTHQISELLHQSDISLGFPIESRVKTLSSIIDKLEHRSPSIKSITELTDFIGLRIILLFKKDVKHVSDILSENFKIVEKEDKLENTPESQFGYSSIHFIIKLPDDWLKIPTFKLFTGLTAEIQVRTVSQHIWAAASHKLQYKDESGVPLPVRRSIHRVSALLETVDLEFERILQEKDEYKEIIRKEPQVTDNELLNVDLLEKVLDDLLPADNKYPGEEDYSELLQDLVGNGIANVKSLKETILKHLDAARKNDIKLVGKMREDFDSEETTEERVKKGVYYTHMGLVRSMISMATGRHWFEYNQD